MRSFSAVPYRPVDGPFHRPAAHSSSAREQETVSSLGNAWRKPSYSNANGGSCVEVAADGVILVRDTTNRGGETLGFSAEAWQAFLGTLR